MNDIDLQEFDSSIRMTEFYDVHTGLFKNNAKAISLKAALVAGIAALEAAGAKRVSATGRRKDGTVDRNAAKTDLYAVVRSVIETAKTIKKEEPDFNNTFKPKRGTMSGAELLATARGFFNNLTEPVAAKFEEYGAVNLTAKLTDKINLFEAARAQQNAGRGSGVAATAQTNAEIKSLKQNRRTLKTIVENILQENGDAGLIAEWQSACRIEKQKSGTPPAAPTS